MAEEVIVFIHDGIVEGVFATSADTHVCIVDFDKDSGDQDYRCSKLKMQASMEQFQKASEFLTNFEYSNGAYCMLAPRKPDDLIEEGRQLSHCVGSYTDRVAALDTFIFFLRRTSDPDRSLVTVQVNTDGRLGQVRGRFNRQPTPEQMRFVEKWHEKFFKNAEVQVA